MSTDAQPVLPTVAKRSEAVYSQTVAWCPDLLLIHHADTVQFPYLLESVARGTGQARYDILFAYPQQRLVLADQELDFAGAPVPDSNFLAAFDHWYGREEVVFPNQSEAHTLPFSGGWFVYLSYECVQQIESGLQLPSLSDNALPTAFAVRCPAAIIRDHLQQKTFLVAESKALLTRLANDYELALRATVPQLITSFPACEIHESPAQDYLQAVQKIKRYILDGDVFQVNLSRRWQVQCASAVNPSLLYARLRASNPAPFAGLVQWDGKSIVSSSPERLVAVDNRIVQTRPIAGTRPRGHSATRDRSASAELLAHPKEQAEHVMLIDLERNDLGRVCIAGSVKVDEFMILESFEHVHHIVSNVRGELRAGISPGQVLAAVFPGGTITGCPKVRCMQIIAELEAQARGAYTGAMGYVNRDGRMDFNILIRTMTQHGNKIEFRAGAGIVADSVAEQELQECSAKALGMLRAITSSQADSNPGVSP